MKTAAGCLLVTVLLAVPADAKTATAERLDAVVRILPGGRLDVTETVVMRFEDGTFDEFTRKLGGRKNDGVAVLEVWMDGRRIAIGDNPGQAEPDGSRLHWRFPPTSSTHTFVVRYLVEGAFAQAGGADMLVWRYPDGSHSWRIESSSVTYELPAGVITVPAVESRRAASTTTAASDAGVFRVTAEGIRRDGWTETTLVMPGGSILTSPPAWQRTEEQQAAYSTLWLGAAGLAFVLGLVPLFALWQGYDRPRRDQLSPTVPVQSFPDSLPPAIAGALVRGGHAALEDAAAALFALAERGDLHVAENKRGTFGTRGYLLTRVDSRQPLAPHEEAALASVFTESGSAAVTLSQTRSRLLRQLKPFSRALTTEMEAHGLLDRDRQATRSAFLRISCALFALSGLSFGVWLLVMEAYGVWPLALPGALVCAATLAAILYGVSTPLSNEGVQRAHGWRAYRDYLKSRSKHPVALSAVPAEALPYAVALGLAGEWSKHLKAHPGLAPHWFRAEGDDSSYAAFVADAGAGASA